MPSVKKYEDMSALTALKYAKNRNLLLPDIQREYEWEISEIERLFESIVDNYPIGSCIFWKTNRKIINNEKPNLYYFIKEFKSGFTKNEKAPEVLSDESDYYIVLDGQQRITSLNIALYGSYTYYKGGRGHNRSNPNSWVTKELYYNLDFYKGDVVDDEHPKKRFCFLSKDETSGGNYYKVKNILAYDSLLNFTKFMISEAMDEKCTDDLSTLYERLNNSSDNGLVHYYCISEDSYDKALDIFVRVNSTGKKLSKSDLLFSTLIDGWKEGKDNVEKLLDVMNCKGDGFQFSRDYLMRLCLVLVDANTDLKINSLTKDTIKNIRDNWNTINSSLDDMTTLLSDIGMCHENMTSYNATMPIAYYLSKGGKIEDKDSKKEVRKFLSVSSAKRLFGVASNSALNTTRNTLKTVDCVHTPFSLSLFAGVTLTGGRTFRVNEQNINYWINHYEKGQSTYIILAILYPDLKLNQVSFHQDHCHPFASFNSKSLKELGLNDDKIKEWQFKRNLLPNLQFLEGIENKSKNKTPLKIWVEDEGNDFKYHPQGISLELSAFEDFFEERRKLIKKELLKEFGLPESVPENLKESAE